MREENTAQHFMAEALDLAREAAEAGEVPVGAVIVRDGKMIGRAGNRTEAQKDPTAHAEMLAIRQALEAVGGWRLTGCDMYVTLEPCVPGLSSTRGSGIFISERRIPRQGPADRFWTSQEIPA